MIFDESCAWLYVFHSEVMVTGLTLSQESSSGSSGWVRGAKKHEIYAAAFGGHFFHDLFSQGRGGAWPLGPPGSATGIIQYRIAAINGNGPLSIVLTCFSWVNGYHSVQQILSSIAQGELLHSTWNTRSLSFLPMNKFFTNIQELNKWRVNCSWIQIDLFLVAWKNSEKLLKLITMNHASWRLV